MKTITLAEIVYNIKNAVNGGDQTDDVKFSDRQMVFIVNHFREKLVAQRLNSGKDAGNYAQKLENVKFEKTRDLVSIEGFTILKTVEKIPAPVSLHNGDGILRVSTRDDFYPFLRTYIDVYNLASASKLTAYMSRYLYYNGHIYVITTDKPSLMQIDINGVFSNPVSVEEFNEGVDEFRGMDFEYPMIPGSLDQLNALIMNNEYRWSKMLPPDLINDGKDE